MEISPNRTVGCGNAGLFCKELSGSAWLAQPASAVGLSSIHGQFLLGSNTSNVIPAGQLYLTVDLRADIGDIVARVCSQIVDVAVLWNYLRGFEGAFICSTGGRRG